MGFANVMSDKQHIVVLGAGITGLTAAWALSKVHADRVILLEREQAVGGLAATFTWKDFTFDNGSHRLHAGHYSEADQLVHDLCGQDLLRRERKGLIHLKDRWLPYPPSGIDILFGFGLRDALRFSADFVQARLARLVRRKEPETFEDFTTQNVGRSLYKRFYEPYARKLYGRPPSEIAKEPAMSRVRKFDLSSLRRGLKWKILKRQPQYYLYPARGIGQIAEELRHRFLANGGQLLFVKDIDRFCLKEGLGIQAVTFTTRTGDRESLDASLVVATIPLEALHFLVRLDSEGNTPPDFGLRWRGLRLLYLITREKIRSDHETFYFPEPHIPFGRVSELNKYSPALNQDPDLAALTVEIPCSPGDPEWEMPEDRLAELCVAELQRLGLLRSPAVDRAEYFSKRLKNVYPLYKLGWRDSFERIYRRLNSIPNLYLIGRSALFLHCNIDHCMAMALKLAGHLSNGHHEKTDWDQVSREFFSYQVWE
jgi:protoporphyrinogen oxidase